MFARYFWGKVFIIVPSIWAFWSSDKMFTIASYLYSALIAVYHFLTVFNRVFSFLFAPIETTWNLFHGQRFFDTPSPEKPIFQQNSSNTTGVIFVSIWPGVFELLRCKFRTHYWEASKNIPRFFGSFRCSAWYFLAFNPAVWNQKVFEIFDSEKFWRNIWITFFLVSSVVFLWPIVLHVQTTCWFGCYKQECISSKPGRASQI